MQKCNSVCVPHACWHTSSVAATGKAHLSQAQHPGLSVSYNTSTDFIFFLIVTCDFGGVFCLFSWGFFCGGESGGGFFLLFFFNTSNRMLQAFAQDQTFLVSAALQAFTPEDGLTEGVTSSA